MPFTGEEVDTSGSAPQQTRPSQAEPSPFCMHAGPNSVRAKQARGQQLVQAATRRELTALLPVTWLAW